MARFSKVIAGTAATRTVKDFEFIGGQKDSFLLRVLSGEQESDVVAWAHQYLIEKKANGSDDLFDHAAAAARCALSAMDCDNPTQPYFESAEEVLSSPLLGKERIAYLAELQSLWQEECSPSLLNLTPAQYEAKLQQIAGSDKPDFFVELRAGTRWIFTRTTVLELQVLRALKLPSGLTSEVISSSHEIAT